MISSREQFEYHREIEYIRAERDWEEREALREMFQLPAKIIVVKEESNESIISKISRDNKEGILT